MSSLHVLLRRGEGKTRTGVGVVTVARDRACMRGVTSSSGASASMLGRQGGVGALAIYSAAHGHTSVGCERLVSHMHENLSDLRRRSHSPHRMHACMRGGACAASEREGRAACADVITTLPKPVSRAVSQTRWLRSGGCHELEPDYVCPV